MPWWLCHSFTPMWSDFFFLCLHNLRVGRSLSDDGAQPQPLSESLHSVPPSSPLEKHFLYGDFRVPQGCPSRSTLFSITPRTQNTLPTYGLEWHFCRSLSSTVLSFTGHYFLKKKKKSKISCFSLSRYSVLLIEQVFLMILEREKGRVSSLLLNFLVCWK